MKEYFLYFDESGNLGSDGRYFTIACILTENPKGLQNKMKKVLNYIKKNYDYVKWNKYELKAASCTPEIKRIIYNALSKKDIEVSYIVADKVYIDDILKRDKNCLYNYLLKLLLDNYKFKFRNNKINIFLDNRSIKVKSQNSFSDYIKIHFNYELRLNCKLNIEYLNSEGKNAYNIQAVDYIANSIYAKYEYNYNDYYEIYSDKVKFFELFPQSKFGKSFEIKEEIAITKKC